VLPDLLRPGLKVVFCGTAAGAASTRAQAYYAGRGNKFWRTLREVEFTPRQLAPPEFRSLLDYDLGLTDVCKVAAGSDREVGNRQWDVPGLLEKLESCEPAWLGFNGKAAAKAVLGRPVGYGLQPERLASVRVYVLPSTSGAASGSWSLEPWHELSRMART
jgi:TDG/mug DNA glycosylase family protein